MTPKAGLFSMLLLLVALPVTAAAVEARLDRTRVAEGETVVLSLDVAGGSAGTPDLAPLMQDFDILSRSQSMRMSMINGRSSSSRGWQLVLAPRRTGRLEVPALEIDGRRSRALTLEVLPAAQAAQLGAAPPVLLEADIEPGSPRVQQKAVYRVRVLSRVPLDRPVVSEPGLRDALVEPLGPETEYRAQRHGQTYQVVERRYAVFPQRSGPLRIEGPVLTALVPDPNAARGPRRPPPPGRGAIPGFDRLFGPDGFASPGRPAPTRRVRLRAPDLSLDVQAQPAGAPAPWLPAESLTLNDDWSAQAPALRVGEPVTRTIAITAQGLTPVQLPDMALAAPDGLKVYPERPRSHARADGDTLIAQKLIAMTLVPTRAGAVTLPAVELAWWDTGRGEPRVARLPPRTIEVAPAPASAVPPPAADRLGAAHGRGLPAGAGARAAGPDERAASRPRWAWVAVILGLAGLVTLALWWGLRRHGAVPLAPWTGAGAGDARAAAAAAPAALASGVEQACRRGDPGAARRALLAWAATCWPTDPPRGLDALAERLDEAARAALRELDEQLYSGAAQRWDGVAAWERLAPPLRAAGQARAHAAPDAPLPPLYPQGA